MKTPHQKLTDEFMKEALGWAQKTHGGCPQEGCLYKQWPSCNYARALLQLHAENEELREAEAAVIDAAKEVIRIDTAPDYGESKRAWDTLTNALTAYEKARNK